MDFNPTAQPPAIMSFKSSQPEGLILSIESGGQIVVHLKDGTVSLVNVSPDKASIEFWRSVAAAFSDAKASICSGKDSP